MLGSETVGWVAEICWVVELVLEFVAGVEGLIVGAVVVAASVAAVAAAAAGVAAVVAAAAVAVGVVVGRLEKPALDGSLQREAVKGLVGAARLLVVLDYQTDCGCLTETGRAAWQSLAAAACAVAAAAVVVAVAVAAVVVVLAGPGVRLEPALELQPAEHCPLAGWPFVAAVVAAAADEEVVARKAAGPSVELVIDAIAAESCHPWRWGRDRKSVV